MRQLKPSYFKRYRKGKKDDYFADKIFRKFSLYTSWLAVKLKVSPNMVTFSSFIMDVIAAGIFLFSGKWIFSLIAGLLVFFSFVLDHSDGEVARYLNEKNKVKNPKRFGSYVDSIFDMLCFIVLFLGIGFGSYFRSGNFDFIILMIFSIIAATLLTATALGSRAYFSDSLKSSLSLSAREKISKIFSKIGLNLDYRLFSFSADVQTLIISVCALIGFPWISMIIFSTVGNFYWILKFWLYRKY